MSTRIACIGAGFIAARHLANLAAMPGVDVVGVADLEGERAREYTARHGGRPYQDWRTMLASEKPDAVYICVPPHAHGEPERVLAEAGVPFFTEKPLGLTADLPERIASEVEKQGLLTSVGYHWRYLDTVDRVRALVQARPPRLVMGYWLDFVPPPAWWIRRDCSGGQMVEQTTHIFDLARYLVGEVRSVFAVACTGGLARYPDCDIDTASTATLQFDTGAIGVIASTCVVHYPHRIGLWLYAQDTVIECCEQSMRIETPESAETFRPQVDPFAVEDQAFVQAVATGDRSGIRVPYGEALLTHHLVQRALESAAAGRPLDL